MKEKGFITIATGDKHYYEIAANLLKSYRYFSKNPLPFAIIAEEENEYTRLFDDVVITTESMHSFTDKFLLAKLCPYYENIFIDSDSLAFGDLNIFWKEFENATDFSAIGANVPVNDTSDKTWYDVDGIGKYGKLINYKTRVHAGLMFIRQSDKLDKLYGDCIELLENYKDFDFHGYEASKDEAVLGVAFPMNDMRAVDENSEIFACFPFMKEYNIDLLHDSFQYELVWGGRHCNGVLCHWGTRFTYEPLYRFNVKCLEYRKRRDEHTAHWYEYLLYEKKLWYRWAKLTFWVSKNWKRILSKLARIMRNI